MTGLRFALRATCMLLWMACICSFVVFAQTTNPLANDSSAAKLGEFQFRSNCSFCHGLGARGGGRGPDLTRKPKKHGNSDAEIFRNIQGGIPGTAMPAAVGSIGVGMSDDEIWQVIAYIRSIEKTSAAITGDATHGELIYSAQGCPSCHMIRGKGGRLGPDLSSVGSARAAEYLTESVRNPSRQLSHGLLEAQKEFPQDYESVTVVAADGTKYRGIILNEDGFTLQMIDVREKVHSFTKRELQSFEKSRMSLMPAYGPDSISDKDLQDIVAFLGATSRKGDVQ
jgi:cytochrome c oxidase cbb3-type subunit III